MTLEELLQILRSNGWSVAMHHDNVYAGPFLTRWMFTHQDTRRWEVGEGATDKEAVAAVVHTLRTELR